jgi:Pentapeptide repeats (8 copies)
MMLLPERNLVKKAAVLWAVVFFQVSPVSAQIDTLWNWKDSAGTPRTRAAFDSAMKEHRAWLDSGKKKGKRASFRYSFFSGHDMSGFNLEGAELAGARFMRTNLHDAVLRDASLNSADLSGAILRNADLSRANLVFANLRDADLRGAILHQADLLGAELSNANIEGVDLSLIAPRARSSFDEPMFYNDSTRWPAGFDLPPNLNTIPAKVNQGLTRILDVVIGRWGGILITVLVVVFTVMAAISGFQEAAKVSAQEKIVKRV